jgi:peptidoglycan/xylan/chitin deacetylase (PgdA/CDA1 family)
VPAPVAVKWATVPFEPAIGPAPNRYAHMAVAPVGPNVTRWTLVLDGGFPEGTRLTWRRGMATVTLPALLSVDGRRMRWEVGLGGVQQVWAGDDVDGGPLAHVEVGLDQDAALIPVEDLPGGTIRLDVMIPPVEERAVAAPAVGEADLWPAYPAPQKMVAFTFDDFPCPGQSERLLEALRAQSIPATFFVIGQKVEGAGELLRRALWDGHTLGNHTYSHRRLTGCTLAEAREEIARCNEAIVKAVGQVPRYFRPPGGQVTAEMEALVAQMGLKLVLWDAMTNDYDRISADQICRDILYYAQRSDRAIICLHDGSAATVEALGPLVHALRLKGYRPVTLDELFGR